MAPYCEFRHKRFVRRLYDACEIIVLQGKRPHQRLFSWVEYDILLYLIGRGASNPYKDEYNPEMDNIPPIATPVPTYKRNKGLPKSAPTHRSTCTCATIELPHNGAKNKETYRKRDECDNMPNTNRIQYRSA